MIETVEALMLLVSSAVLLFVIARGPGIHPSFGVGMKMVCLLTVLGAGFCLGASAWFVVRSLA